MGLTLRHIRPRSWLTRTAALLAMLCAIALFALVLAWWIWRWFAPAPVPGKMPQVADPIEALRVSGLFAAPGAAVPLPEKAEAQLLAGETRLIGVFAEAGGAGYALFRGPAGSKLVRAGQEISNGATLVSVQADGITIRDGGGKRDIALRAAKDVRPAPAVRPPSAARPGGAATAAVASSAAACTPPTGFRGTVVRLNAELLQGMIRQPESWKALAAPERGALAIRDDSGFAAMLSMKKGDRVELANGIALTVPEDVVNAVLKPLAASQAVRLVGSRDGTAREWLVLNAGSCAPS